jgi:hypothetical protein
MPDETVVLAVGADSTHNALVGDTTDSVAGRSGTTSPAGGGVATFITFSNVAAARMCGSSEGNRRSRSTLTSQSSPRVSQALGFTFTTSEPPGADTLPATRASVSPSHHKATTAGLVVMRFAPMRHRVLTRQRPITSPPPGPDPFPGAPRTRSTALAPTAIVTPAIRVPPPSSSRR